MRIFGNWLDSYIKHVERANESPRAYNLWSGATIISASLKRHVWFDRGTWKMMPNLFTVLVGRPGIGKGAAINPAINILKKAGTANMLSDRITIEYVMEKLSKGFPSMTPSGGGIVFQLGEASAVLTAPELSIFITASLITLPILADLWDAREGKFQYGTRGKGDYDITSPCVSLLGGSTSEWLISAIPSNAVGGGFTRRVNFVYAKDKRADITPPTQASMAPEENELVEDLKAISLLRGEFKYQKSVFPLFEAYKRDSSKVNEFDDEAVASYKSSKWVHVTKLGIAMSAARGDSMEISKEDFEQAIDAVDKCGQSLGLVFRAVGESDLSTAGDRVLRFIESKGYASRQDILAANWRHISATDLDIVINTLTEGGLIFETRSGSRVVYKAVPQVPIGMKAYP